MQIQLSRALMVAIERGLHGSDPTSVKPLCIKPMKQQAPAIRRNLMAPLRFLRLAPKL